MGNGNEALATLLAAAKQQINASGDDEGPITALTAVITRALEQINATQLDLNTKMKSLETKISDSLVEQVIEGQQKILHQATRRGGFQTLDNADIYRQSIDPAGFTMEQKLVMPEYQLKKYLPPEQVDRIRIFQELNDDAIIIGWVKALKATKSGETDSSGINYRAHLSGTRTWASLQAIHKALTTAGAATGLEWMPTQFSSQLIDVITVSLKVAANFARIIIPANTFKVPIATTDDIAFLVAENTSDNLLDETKVFPKFTPGTGNITFNAKKIAAIVVFSEEAEEDSIIPMLAFIRTKVANSMSNAQERATLDGDTTATHMDNDVSAATDVRKTWKGMRYTAKTVITNTVDCATFNMDTIRSIREAMTAAFSENPENLVYVTSVKVMLKMLKFPEFLTIDKYGDKATIITGEVGRIDGSPLQTSKYSRDDVAATGVNTSGGPNTKSLLYLQNRLAWWYGDRREIRIDSGRMLIQGNGYFVTSQRIDFKEAYPSTSTVNKHAGLGINI